MCQSDHRGHQEQHVQVQHFRLRQLLQLACNRHSSQPFDRSAAAEIMVLSLLISIKVAHASRPRGARAREIHFVQISYSTLRRTSHHSDGPRNFDILVIRRPCGPFPCVCMLLQNSQSANGARSVFGIQNTFLGSFNSYQELRSRSISIIRL